MEKIKFRAWDKKERKMRNWDEIILEKEWGNEYYLLGYKLNRAITNYDHEQILMQYTGIKNMDNGVEICEGDILRLPNGKKRTVFKVPGGFAIESLDCDYGKYGKRACVPIEGLSDEQNANFVAQQCTVVGNIYENPELLEEV